MKKKIFITLTVAAVSAYWLLFSGISAEDIKRFLEAFGIWAPLAYMAAFTVLPAFFFPVAVLALAGGLLFGFWNGALYTFLGAILNCSLMFWIARSGKRHLAEAWILKRFSGKGPDILTRLSGREGFFFLVLLRLIPAVPYNLINYAYGLSGMPYKTYILASVIGIIPGTFAFINIGDKALDVSSPGFWLAVGLLLFLLAVTTWMGKCLFPNQTNGDHEHEQSEK